MTSMRTWIPWLLYFIFQTDVLASKHTTGASPEPTDGANAAKMISAGDGKGDTPAAGSEKSQNAAVTTTDSGSQKLSYFSGGCFWGIAYTLQQLVGVDDVLTGYMGGKDPDPTYRTLHQSACEPTGPPCHAETVQVSYDPSKISYSHLARVFFEIHNPFQVNGQGPDIGPQYRSIAFYSSVEEENILLGLKKKLEDGKSGEGETVQTQFLDRNQYHFWKAEEEHQHYYPTAERSNHGLDQCKRYEDKNLPASPPWSGWKDGENTLAKPEGDPPTRKFAECVKKASKNWPVDPPSATSTSDGNSFLAFDDWSRNIEVGPISDGDGDGPRTARESGEHEISNHVDNIEFLEKGDGNTNSPDLA